MVANIVILSIIAVLFVFAVRYVLRNGTCGGCPAGKAAKAGGGGGGGGYGPRPRCGGPPGPRCHPHAALAGCSAPGPRPGVHSRCTAGARDGPC